MSTPQSFCVRELSQQYQAAIAQGQGEWIDLALVFPDAVQRLQLPASTEVNDWTESYFTARLFNWMTVASPQQILLKSPENEQIREKLQVAIQRLQVPPLNRMAGILTRFNEAEFKVALVNELPAAVAAPNDGQTDWPGLAEGLLAGIDLGGTDLKIVLVKDGELILEREQVWDVKPKAFTSGEQYAQAMIDFLEVCLEEAGEGYPKAIGISFPDVIKRNQVLGGMTSKYQALRQPFMEPAGEWLDEIGYWQLFNGSVRVLADRLSAYFSEKSGSLVPARITNDGNVGSLWAAVQTGKQGVLNFSLGTSLAGGYCASPTAFDRAGIFEVGNLMVRVGEPGYARFCHNAFGFAGSGQQLLSQDAVFTLALEAGILDEYPTGQEAQTLKALQARIDEPEIQQIFEQMGRFLVDVYEVVQEAAPGQEANQLVLFGRGVRGESGKILCASAEAEFAARGLAVSLHLAGALNAGAVQCANPEALAQAVGSVYLASMAVK